MSWNWSKIRLLSKLLALVAPRISSGAFGAEQQLCSAHYSTSSAVFCTLLDLFLAVHVDARILETPVFSM